MPNPQNIQDQHKINQAMADERQERFLTVLEKAAYPPEGQKVQYPNISHVLRNLNIPRGTYTRWLSQDKQFRARYDDCMEAFDEACLKSLYDANQEKWGVAYAATWLKYRGKLREHVEHGGQISQIHLVSRVREEDPVLSTEN